MQYNVTAMGFDDHVFKIHDMIADTYEEHDINDLMNDAKALDEIARTLNVVDDWGGDELQEIGAIVGTRRHIVDPDGAHQTYEDLAKILRARGVTDVDKVIENLKNL